MPDPILNAWRRARRAVRGCALAAAVYIEVYVKPAICRALNNRSYA